MPSSHVAAARAYSKAFQAPDETVFAIISSLPVTIRLAGQPFLLHLPPCGYFYSLTGSFAIGSMRRIFHYHKPDRNARYSVP
jgi:hypothetical protein